ncbi:MAG: diaminopimelate epimerase [Spirochaetes bacterium]|nr:diaminopimelate epimerase [Spirochaetota bacterium]
MPFIKMQGIGNDYIYINAIKNKITNPSALAVKMSNRNFGIGSDGIILICESEKSDFKMKMFNSDGSESEMCGNGIRCLAKLVYDHKMTKKTELEIETLAGVKKLSLKLKNQLVHEVTVDMGEPNIERTQIPMSGNPGTVIEEPLTLDDGVTFNITSVSMGNPHSVIFVDDVDNFPVSKYGPFVENNDVFPNRTNVEFVQIINENEVRQRTWERGSGETLACGTGSCATVVAGTLARKLNRNVLVHLRGGDLKIEWDVRTNHVFMTGPAVEVYEGIWKS